MTPGAELAVAASGLLLGLAIVGSFHRSIRRVLAEFFGTITNAAEDTAVWFRTQRESLRGWIDALFTSEGATTPGERVTFFIGAVFNTCFFLVFVAADFSLTVLTLAALGMTEGAPVHLPWDLDVVTGISVLLPAVFLGLMLMDLGGMTRLAPWHRLSRPLRMTVTALCIAGFALSLVLMVSLGLFRASALQEAGADIAGVDPEGINGNAAFKDGESLALQMVQSTAGVVPAKPTILPASMTSVREIVPWIIMPGIPALLTLTALFSGIGPLILLVYVAIGGVGLLCVGTWVAEVIFLLCRSAATTVWATLEAVFSLVARLGIALVRPAVSLSRNFVRTTTWETAGGFRRVVLAFASVVDDLEVPEDGVGMMAMLPDAAAPALPETGAPQPEGLQPEEFSPRQSVTVEADDSHVNGKAYTPPAGVDSWYPRPGNGDASDWQPGAR